MNSKLYWTMLIVSTLFLAGAAEALASKNMPWAI